MRGAEEVELFCAKIVSTTVVETKDKIPPINSMEDNPNTRIQFCVMFNE
jgi:hypothetical protein